MLSPKPEQVLPHLKRLEEAFDVMLSCGDEQEVLTADLLGVCTDGRPEVLVAPYGGSHIESVRKLPVADDHGRPLPATLKKRAYVGGTEVIIDTPYARYHLLH